VVGVFSKATRELFDAPCNADLRSLRVLPKSNAAATMTQKEISVYICPNEACFPAAALMIRQASSVSRSVL
jgi:hypothetical protein